MGCPGSDAALEQELGCQSSACSQESVTAASSRGSHHGQACRDTICNGSGKPQPATSVHQQRRAAKGPRELEQGQAKGSRGSPASKLSADSSTPCPCHPPVSAHQLLTTHSNENKLQAGPPARAMLGTQVLWHLGTYTPAGPSAPREGAQEMPGLSAPIRGSCKRSGLFGK